MRKRFWNETGRGACGAVIAVLALLINCPARSQLTIPEDVGIARPPSGEASGKAANPPAPDSAAPPAKAPPQDRPPEKRPEAPSDSGKGVSGTLEVSPKMLVLTPSKPSGEIQVSAGGKKVPASMITANVQGGHGWMFQVSKPSAQGVVAVRAHPEKAEHGEYDLVVSAGGQSITVKVVYGEGNAVRGQLSDLARKYAGLRLQSFRLDEYYTLGTELSLEIAAPQELRYDWFLNGKRAAGGVGTTSAKFRFDAAGQQKITIIVSADGTEISRCDSLTMVRK